MSDNDNTLEYDENDLIDSPLSQILQEDNEQIEVLIYRLPDSDWTLEVVNQNGTSTVPIPTVFIVICYVNIIIET